MGVIEFMVGPNGLEPSTSSVSRMRSNQTELRAYMLYQNVIPFYASSCEAATPQRILPLHQPYAVFSLDPTAFIVN